LRTIVSVPFLAASLAVFLCLGAASAQPSSVGAQPSSAGSTAAPAASDSAKALPAKSKAAKKAKPSVKKAAAPADSADPYGVAPAKKDSVKPAPAPATARVDSAKAASPLSGDTAKKVSSRPDSAKAAVAADTSKAALARPDTTAKADTSKAGNDSAKVAGPVAADSAAADTSAGKPKKRKRIVRETTVNSIDELKGRYRSPKKALFMSLIVPGLGQAYVGQHWSNYARGAAYFLADVALLYGWHFYVVEKQDREIAQYKRFADTHWRQANYEDSIKSQVQVNFVKDRFDKGNTHRGSYCESVQEAGTGSGKDLYNGCKDPNSSGYDAFKTFYDDSQWPDDTVSARRALFPNSQSFYEIIGKYDEFITGWDDANVNPIIIGDTTYSQLVNGKLVTPTTDHQQQYVSMRDQANEYARMQSYFLGGIVLNHIVSAVDAALTAHFHNLALYQTEVRWYERVHLQSRVAMQDGLPAPTVAAVLTF
jgi:hypothetical protein